MESPIHVVLKAEELGTIFGFPLTNSILMAWLVMALLIGFSILFRKKIAMVPGMIQTAIEWAVEGALAYISETLESEVLARRFFPLLATIFLFILFVNELEFFPGVGSIGIFHGHELVPFFHAPTADLNFTLALAFIAFFTIEITGLAALGVFKYTSKYVNLTSPVGFAVGIIEFISNLGRLISFSFRLFGNVFAGEVMILVIGTFVPYLLPVPFMGFEMFIGLIQALVFSMLTLFFIKLAVMEPHGTEKH
jgi:F-type H+-transporting ATPase subunit a